MNNQHNSTWRERLADWLTGGRYSAPKKHYIHTIDQYSALAEKYSKNVDLMIKYRAALRAIHAATKDGKSGTARKVARMAEEALK